MVTLTESAAELLQHIQEAKGLAETPRLVRNADRLAVIVSPPDPQDEVLYHNDQPVLRVAADAAPILADCTITTQETAEGPQLAIVPQRPPNGQVADTGA